MSRLGLEALIDDTVRPGGSAGSGAGRKVLSLVASMLVGGCCIDAAAAAVGLGGGGAALRGGGAVDCGVVFAVVHVRACAPARQSGRAGASPGVVCGRRADAGEMTLDLDSTVCEVCGKAKHGAAYGHTKVLGYHPLVAVRSDTGEVLHSRMRSGSSQRGNVHFARETLARLRRLGAHAAVTVRADAGFFSYDMIAAIGAHGASYSITIPQNAQVKAAAAAIVEAAWAPIAYTRGGEAQVAETTIEAGRRGDKLRGPDAKPAKLRLVRRSRLLGARASCGPTGATTASSPTGDLDTKAADANHRGHATVELAIRTSKRAPGSAAAPQDSSPPTAPGSPAACSRTTSPAGLGRTQQRSPSRTTGDRAGRRGHDCAAAQLVAEHLHHRPARATCPCSSPPCDSWRAFIGQGT